MMEAEEDEAMLFYTGEGESPPSCGKGHRSSLRLETSEGGSICLVCFSNLLSNPTSPSIHVSYALSQLSQAIQNPLFYQNLTTFHSHLLIPPLTQALASFDDQPLARQTIHLITRLCDSNHANSASVSGDFVARISDRLSSGSLAWSQRQIYTLHCLGVLLNRQTDDNPSIHIKDRGALISNLVQGLQLPSEEIHGEILFVLYKLSLLQEEEEEVFLCFCSQALYLSLEALVKTQNDDVRLNCIALLTVLACRGYLRHLLANDPSTSNVTDADNFMQKEPMAGGSLIILFANAIKGPLLSSDTQVQNSALDLIFHALSSDAISVKQIQILIEESVADYVFEILRLSENKDPLVISCLRVLDILATAEQAFRQSLAIGFSTLVPVLHYVGEIPLHPVQLHTLKLVWSCISHCPGILSRSQVEELVLVLTGIFRRHASGEMGMLSEIFTMACSTFVILLKLPSSQGITLLAKSVQDAARNAVLSSLGVPRRNPNNVFLYSLYLLKEAYAYSHEENSNMNLDSMELATCIIDVCQTNILPWLRRAIDEVEEEEEIILGILETFNSILLQASDVHARKFAELLASSSWFSLSFGCLGLFPSDQMKCRVYLMLSSIVDGVFGHDFGQPIRDAAQNLPSDPTDLLFLLGQKSSHDPDLTSCQSAVLLILYTSSLHDERLADDRQVLASLEQYILVNSTNFFCGVADSGTLTQLVHLYGFFRGVNTSCRAPYSPEAEKLLFHLIVENEWDLLSTRIHPTGLKWLFQQEQIRVPLSNHVLRFCRSDTRNNSQSNDHENINHQIIDIQVIAELVAAGDNCGASLLVSLLKQFHEEGQEDDITSVLNIMIDILNIFPIASDQFCLHGIGDTICRLYYSAYSRDMNFTTCLLLIFNILRSAQPKMLSDNDAWLPITMKLLEVLIAALDANTSNKVGNLIMSIFSLILHHSTNHALPEPSKAILLNTSLVSAIDTIIHATCAKGPALADHDEETSTGETIIFVLILNFFSIRSMYALLQGTMEWQDFLHSSNGTQPLNVICIRSNDLCRLIHFGSSSIKLVASQCLLELFTRISDERNTKRNELRCSLGYLKSVMAVLEGLVFYGDIKVSMNCGLCLSMILGWEKLGSSEKRVIEENKWCRVVIEELALSLAAPGLASKSFTNQHKPATHIAIALLRLDEPPEWMKSVFDGSCISGIIGNLSANNVSTEMVKLFRELVACEYLNAEQIIALDRVFQACRKHVYMESSQDQSTEELFEKVEAIPDDLGKACRLLIHLMSLQTVTFGQVQTEQKRLLEEIEMFSLESSARE
ncbi:putative recombination initiation defect 1 [Tasmannia lanceolata]|uniref:putative recombination initiation defect 1 n=1 Tax=Tasmannia lanceolata TaxID=3420 RepID=UPI0040648DE2